MKTIEKLQLELNGQKTKYDELKQSKQEALLEVFCFSSKPDYIGFMQIHASYDKRERIRCNQFYSH